MHFITKAQEVNTLSDCSNSICLTNISNIKVSSDGSFFVITDSIKNSYIRKVNFSANSTFNSEIINLNDPNPNSAPFTLAVSQNNKKIIAFREENEKSSVPSKKIESTILLQETACKCTSNNFYNGSICASGMLVCPNTSDTVCGCDNLNYLNSCVARANGVKSFTKSPCGSTSTFTCSTDDQCPLSTCSDGTTFKKFACTSSGMCNLVTFSSDPCTLTTSSSGDTTTNCKCSSGNFFDEKDCSKGILDCSNTATDNVCGCDNKNYLNSCIARANGIKKFTKGGCGSDSGLTCSTDDQCPIGSCPDGERFKRFTCTNGKCTQITFSIEPCSIIPKGEGLPTLVHFVDLTNNSVKTFNPFIENDDSSIKELSISTLSFLDAEGGKLIASDNDEENPNLNIIDTENGIVEKMVSIPESARSIEFSPDFSKAIITFKEKFSHSIGIYINKTSDLVKVDIPSSIFFKIDEFLSEASFDLFNKKAVVSSLGGKHVLHLVDLKDNRLTVLFLNNEIEGKTLSAISPDGTFVISVSNIFDKDGIVVYKINSNNPRKPNLLKQEKFIDKSKVLDVKVTPDNNNVLILVSNNSEVKIKMLNLNDLSLVCEYKISSDNEQNFLIPDPLGRYIVVPDLKNNSINIITKLQGGPVFKSISPGRSKVKEGTEFTITGFIDLIRFTDSVKVCFRNKNFCSSLVKVSNDGKTIMGTTPRFPSKTNEALIIIAGNKGENESNGNSINSSSLCPLKPNIQSKYNKVFKFE